MTAVVRAPPNNAPLVAQSAHGANEVLDPTIRLVCRVCTVAMQAAGAGNGNLEHGTEPDVGEEAEEGTECGEIVTGPVQQIETRTKHAHCVRCKGEETCFCFHTTHILGHEDPSKP